MISDADIDQAVDELVERYGANAISVARDRVDEFSAKQDQPGVNVVDGVVDDQHIGLDIQHTELEVHQVLPAAVTGDSGVDHLDLIETRFDEQGLE